LAPSVETPRLLVNLSTVLHGLRLRPGDAVLDFGAWHRLARARADTAGLQRRAPRRVGDGAEYATELYRRLPVVGDRPAPEFVQFDGRSIPLPDSSVDSHRQLRRAPSRAEPSDMIASSRAS